MIIYRQYTVDATLGPRYRAFEVFNVKVTKNHIKHTSNFSENFLLLNNLTKTVIPF